MSGSERVLELDEAVAAIDLGGSLFAAQRVHALARSHGERAAPFLDRAVREGSPPVAAAALHQLSRIDPLRAAPLALPILVDRALDPELRAAAAEALAADDGADAVRALVVAWMTDDRPMVTAAALDALRRHRGMRARAALLDHTREAVAELERSPDASVRLAIEVAAERSYAELEPELLVWWRSHPDGRVRSAAARALLGGGVERACAILAEGVPGANTAEPHPPAGELDNATVRFVLADAAFVVLRDADPALAFDRLSPYLDPPLRKTWFGEVRARVILLLLRGQAGQHETSWLLHHSMRLHERGVPPDPRWRRVTERWTERGSADHTGSKRIVGK